MYSTHQASFGQDFAMPKVDALCTDEADAGADHRPISVTDLRVAEIPDHWPAPDQPRNMNKIISDDGEGYSTRRGSEFEFHWQYKDKYVGTVECQLGFDINANFDAVQRWYGRLDHKHGRYGRNVVEEPFKDVIRFVARQLKQRADDLGVRYGELALAFVQSLPYQADMGGYQRYASECLLDRQGDCSDTSVLYAALMDVRDIAVIFLEFPTHLMVGVRRETDINDLIDEATYYEHRSHRYYTAETTGWGWKVGQCDDCQRAVIYDCW